MQLIKGISLDQVEIDRGNAQNNSVTYKKAPASDDEDRLV
jgi:hypothetical protein